MTHTPKYLVIDVVTPLLGPQLSGITAHGHAVMTEFMRRLRSIAASCGTTVLVRPHSHIFNDQLIKRFQVVNKATRVQEDEKTEKKPALGPSFTFMSDTTLWLSDMKELSDKAFTHELRILKSRDKVQQDDGQRILEKRSPVTGFRIVATICHAQRNSDSTLARHTVTASRSPALCQWHAQATLS